MNWQRIIPARVTLPLLAAVVAGVLFVGATLKSYISGPDLALTTIYRPKPVPVRVETVKWLKGDVRIKRETVTVPVEVIKEVPAATEKKLLGFGITLKDLQAENKELANVVDVPKAPHGGEMAITVNTGSGKIEGTFLAKQAPLVEFGGIREAGVDYNVIQRGVTGYYRQDLVRLGPAIVNGKAFVTMPMSPNSRPAYGAMVGVAVRF